MPLALRRTLASLTVAFLAFIATMPAPAPARAFEMHICDYCRREWDDSPSRMRAIADANGHDKIIVVCSPYCLAEVLRLKPHWELVSAQVVLWDEREELNAMMVSASNAKFLVGVKDKTDRSHDPDVAAFRTDKQVADNKKGLGGEAIGWDKLLARCKKLVAEADDSGAGN
jgi:hypothetical protein